MEEEKKMEEQKSDKRKASDKSGSGTEEDELNDSSVITQAPSKRPRLNDSGEVEDVFLSDSLNQEEEPAAAAVHIDEMQMEMDSDIPLSMNAGSSLEELQLSSHETSNGDVAIHCKSSIEIVGEDGANKLNVLDEEPGSDSSVGPADLIINEHLNTNGGEDHINDDDGGGDNAKDDDSGEHHINANDEQKKTEQEQAAGSGPLITSSPDSDKSDLPPAEVDLHIKVLHPTTGKVMQIVPPFRSDFLRLEAFLQQHNVGLLPPFSQDSGYSADIDTQEKPSHVFTVPTPPGQNRKFRFTSSTLGSSIARESMKTILSEHPADLNESRTGKPRGKKSPKLHSTNRQSSLLSTSESETSISSYELDPSSRYNFLPSSAKKMASKKVSPNTKKGSSGSKQTKPAKKRKRSSTSSSEGTTSKDSTAITPKHTSNSTLKRLGIAEASTQVITPSSKVEPSPVRPIAIVEGSSAKPLSKFEQDVNNEKVDLNDPTIDKSKTLWTTVGPGEPVFARWNDKNYYSGIVKEKSLNDTWSVDFDDSTCYVASDGHILPIKILGVGLQGVYCPDDSYSPRDATIMGQKFIMDPELGNVVKYAVQIKNLAGGVDYMWCTRRMLSLKENYARHLRQEYQPTSKAQKAAEISLDNVITEGRRRVSKPQTPIVQTPTLSAPRSKSKAIPVAKKKKILLGGAFDASATDSEDFKSTPILKKKSGKSKKNLSESGGGSFSLAKMLKSDTSSSSASLSEHSEKSSSDSPKKLKGKHGDGKGRLFDGYQFFLTACGSQDPTGTGSAVAVASVPYDKDEYRGLIENKGGVVVDLVGEEIRKGKTFLISDNYARTVKYIYSLAANIPCVSYKWIQECISQNKVLPWKPHELHAGYSLENSKVISCHKQKPLKGFQIYITGATDDLYNYWKPVLMAAEAVLLKPPKRKGGKVDETDIPDKAQIVVTDLSCPREVLSKALTRALPVVKPEWLVQSIISGRRADFFNHEKYRVDLSEPDDEDDDEYDDDEDEES